MDYCLPNFEATKDYFESKESGGLLNAGHYYLSIYQSSTVIYWCVPVAVLVALVYLKLLDWFADELAYLTVFAIGASQFILGYIFYQKSGQIQ